jgi:hypothetical protein
MLIERKHPLVATEETARVRRPAASSSMAPVPVCESVM